MCYALLAHAATNLIDLAGATTVWASAAVTGDRVPSLARARVFKLTSQMRIHFELANGLRTNRLGTGIYMLAIKTERVCFLEHKCATL